MITCVVLLENELKSSCADLIRVSTSLTRRCQGVDGRNKSGQDEIGQGVPSLHRRKIFPGQLAALGAERVGVSGETRGRGLLRDPPYSPHR